MNSPTIRPTSRPSTPTRRSLTPSLSTSTTSSASRTAGSNSRPSSPSPRVRPPPQPINHADFSHESAPNLRTTLRDRPLSAGRSRPAGSTTVKGNLESSNTNGSITRRHSSPIVNRGRIAEPPEGAVPVLHLTMLPFKKISFFSHKKEVQISAAALGYIAHAQVDGNMEHYIERHQKHNAALLLCSTHWPFISTSHSIQQAGAFTLTIVEVVQIDWQKSRSGLLMGRDGKGYDSIEAERRETYKPTLNLNHEKY
ncbi:hypothetical protein Tco_1182393 [Tanacetum coccineum]